jgi:hypothetical protein
MRYLIEFVALAVGLPLLLRYFKARPEKFRGPPPHVFRGWSRGGQLTFVWVSLILTVLVAIPAGLFGVFAFLDVDLCTNLTAATGVCHGSIRYAFAIGLFILVGVGTLKWSAFLSRIQNFKGIEFVE